ncbi:MAG: ABC transporter permease, partial [bacterium]
ALAGGTTPIPVDVRPDLRLLLFTAGLATATVLLFGLLPAVRGTRIDLWPTLKADERISGAARRRTFGGLVVIAQVALSLVLVFGAGLFARSLRNLMRVPPGYDRENVLTVRMDPRAAGYAPSQLPDLYRRLIERVRTVPGVRSASVSLGSIAGGVTRTSGISAQGYVPRVGERSNAQEVLVGPDYFATVGMVLLRGRDFDARDAENAARVAIINETMAQYYFPGQDPIGRHFGYSAGHLDFEVVGLVRDAKVNNLREATPRVAFRPVFQEPEYLESIDVRVDNASALAADIRRIVSDVDRNLPILGASTLSAQVARTMTQERLVARLSGLLGLFALALACLGLYGVTSYSVALRTPEIGIRMAIGARSISVRRMVLIQTIRLVVIGLIVGTPLSLGLARSLATQLFGLTATDPLTLVGSALLLASVTALAADIPARRASHLDPMTALRSE